ncbi:MAG: alpha/beta fold hydrolase [Lawsonella clevelandensis]
MQQPAFSPAAPSSPALSPPLRQPPLTATPGTDDSFLRTAPTVPVHQGQYGPDTTLTQARKAAGVTTGKPWPYDTTLNLEIPDASAYRAIPEIRTPGCTLTKEHPNPVVLVHGTWANAQKWNVLAPYLQKHGYCVFAMNYGFDARSSLYNNPKDGKFATNNIYSSAIELNNYVNQVLKLTGAKKFDLVGHSQAGLVFHLWMHDFRGNLRTQHSITLAGTNHGTTMMGLSTSRLGQPRPRHQPLRRPLQRRHAATSWLPHGAVHQLAA